MPVPEVARAAHGRNGQNHHHGRAHGHVKRHMKRYQQGQLDKRRGPHPERSRQKPVEQAEPAHMQPVPQRTVIPHLPAEEKAVRTKYLQIKKPGGQEQHRPGKGAQRIAVET